MHRMHPLRQSKNIRGILAQEIDVKGRYHAKILSTSTKHSKSCQVVPASQTTGAPTNCIAWSAWHPAGGPLSERKRSRSSRIWARNVCKSPLVSYYSCFLLFSTIWIIWTWFSRSSGSSISFSAPPLKVSWKPFPFTKNRKRSEVLCWQCGLPPCQPPKLPRHNFHRLGDP